LSPVPLLVGVAFWRLMRGLRGDATYSPYLWSVALFGLGYAGLLIGIYPYLVPYGLDIHQAAAAPNAQALLLAGAAVLLPLILGYTAWVYWIFRGKVKADAGYH
jgi:cytochrome d ubiquinol oxidase subunit II